MTEPLRNEPLNVHENQPQAQGGGGVNGAEQVRRIVEEAKERPTAPGNLSLEDFRARVLEMTYGGDNPNKEAVTRIGADLAFANRRAVADKEMTFSRRIETLIKTIKTIDSKTASNEYKLPQLTIDILSKINTTGLQNGQGEGVILYSLIERSLGKSHLDSAELRTMAVEIYRLRYVNDQLAAKVVKEIIGEMKKNNFDINSDPVLISVETFINSHETSTKVRNYAGTKQEQFLSTSISEMINPTREGADGLISRRRVSEILGHPEDSFEVESELKRARSGLLRAYNAVRDNGNSSVAQANFQQQLQELFAQGYITQAAAEQVNQYLSNLFEIQSKLGEINYDGSTLIQEMARAGVRLTGKNRNVLMALENGEVFIDYLTNKGYYDPVLKHLDWEKVVEDVEAIFDSVLSVADGHLNDEFDHALNPMYAGHFLDVLLMRIEDLSSDLGNMDRGKIEVDIDYINWVKDPRYMKQNVYGGGPLIASARKATRKKDLATSIHEDLRNEMNHKIHNKRFLHNSEMIARKGLGWEQLKNYSEMMRMDDFDRMTAKDEILNEAYNLYLQAIEEDLALNYHVVGNEWGFEDMDGLDSTQKRVISQLTAKYAHTREEDESNDAFGKRMRNKVLMASGLSKGLTGEFWGKLLSGRTPILWEEYKYKDANGVERIGMKVKATFISGHHIGYEKMIGGLDPTLLAERFNLPNQLKLLPDLPVPKDPNNMPEAFGKMMWLYEKDMVYWYAKDRRTATALGRTQRCIEADKWVRPISERVRMKAVDALVRLGWRMVDYRSHTIYSPDGTIDFMASIDSLRRLGPVAIKVFMDDMDESGDVKLIKREDVQQLIGIDKAGNELNGKEKGNLKAKVYEKYIIENIFNTTPSQFVCLENRRFSTYGETFIMDRTSGYLNGIFQTYGYPPNLINGQVQKLFQSALSLAERCVQEQKAKSGASMQYVFGREDLYSAQDVVWKYFELSRSDVGKIHLKSVDKVNPNIKDSIDFCSEITNKQQFMEMLEGYLGQIRTHLAQDYWDDENLTVEANRLRQNHSPLPQKLLGEKVTLVQRYSTLYIEGDGNIEYLIGGNNFNFHDFNMSGGGSRLHGRMWQEVAEGAEKANKNFIQIGKGLVAFAVNKMEDSSKQLEQLWKESVVKPIKAMYEAYAGTIGEDSPAGPLARDLGNAALRAISYGPLGRIWGYGTLKKFREKNFTGAEQTLVADAVGSSPQRELNALTNGDEIRRAVTVLINECPVIKENETTNVDYEPRKENAFLKMFGLGWFGRSTPKPIKEPAKVNAQQMLKAVGESARSKLIETKGPVSTIALLFALLALLWLARKKNSGKQ